jgi:hypothetical protein
MTFKKGDAVQHKHYSDYTGIVKAVHTITFLDKPITVYDVAWDGNPISIPMRCRDESGSGTKRGYRVGELQLI